LVGRGSAYFSISSFTIYEHGCERVQGCGAAGVWMMNIHASGGRAMMQRRAKRWGVAPTAEADRGDGLTSMRKVILPISALQVVRMKRAASGHLAQSAGSTAWCVQRKRQSAACRVRQDSIW